MSCTHDCGCTPEIRDARTDEWVQIAPESARPATLTPERPVKAPGEDKPAQEPVLPRRIKPEDVRVGMIIERRKGECYVGGRVKSIDGSRIWLGAGVVAWVFGSICGNYGWSLWLVEDEPAPVDPDAEALDQMAQAMANLVGSDDADEWVPWAEVALDALRETHDVTPRAEE